MMDRDMNLVSIFGWTVFAAETIISPLPDSADIPGPPKPKVSFAQLISPLPAVGQVLGESTIVSPRVTPLPIPPTNEPVPQVSKKRDVTIALLGDSMIDTLGPDAPHLKSTLSSLYPATRFTIVNFGAGGTNIEYGIERITNRYEYLGKQVSSLVSAHPDIVVVESFGYNPLPDANGGIDRHWLALAKIIDVLKNNLRGVKIVIAATIAPNAKVFGDGAAGLSFSDNDKWQRVDVIKKYLESTVKFAKSQHLPLADAFHPSLGPDGNGNLGFINPGDHIHYSDAGRQFFAQVVAQAIVDNHLLK